MEQSARPEVSISTKTLGTDVEKATGREELSLFDLNKYEPRRKTEETATKGREGLPPLGQETGGRASRRSGPTAKRFMSEVRRYEFPRRHLTPS